MGPRKQAHFRLDDRLKGKLRPRGQRNLLSWHAEMKSTGSFLSSPCIGNFDRMSPHERVCSVYTRM
jgi:hypothetical protein